MAKLSTTFVIAMLLVFTLICAARPEPSLLKTQPRGAEIEKVEVEEGASCEGLENETEECLRRKTMDAHIDYIYTQQYPDHGSHSHP